MVIIMYYVNCFFVYSIIGFLFEHLVCLIGGQKGQSGILYGPWTPVYGIGIIILIVIANFIFKNLHASKFLQTFVIFLTVIVLLTCIEYIGGILIEKFFKTSLWDYSNMKFHLGKYIALEISLLWGVLSIFTLYVIKPLLDKVIQIIPPYITYIAIALFFCDIALTVCLQTKIKDYLSFLK